MPSNVTIKAAIVPHHLTAGETIATGIKALTGQSFKKILLLSPDHFFQCPTIACTTNGAYQTLFGEVDADPATLSTLLASPLVTNQPEMFKNEHGIFAVLPFIAHYFPGVPVTPLALSQVHPWKTSEEVWLDLIGKAVDDQTLLVVSSDFSHYLPLTVAEQKDAATQRTLLAGDLDAILSLENPSQSDCPNCLWTLGSLAKARSFYQPKILLHTNSALILNDPTLTSTTSHFAIIWEQN